MIELGSTLHSTLHAETKQQLQNFIDNPGHALLLSGLDDGLVNDLARTIAATLLHTTAAKLLQQPGYKEYSASENQRIAVAEVREIAAFFMLKSLGTDGVKRVVVIGSAQLMTLPAQHALLKMLEEPPTDTVLVLATSLPGALLPTVHSRCQKILVRQTSSHDSLADPMSVDSRYTTEYVKHFLGLPVFAVDTIAKERSQAVVFIEQLLFMSQKAIGVNPSKQWQRIMAASLTAYEALCSKGNVKLALTELVLSLR